MDKLIRITTVPVSMFLLLRNQLRFMSHHYDVIGVASNGELLQKIEDQEGIRTVAIDMSRRITPFKDLQGLWKLYRLMKKEKPLIVHTHSPKAGLLGMLAARLAGVPIRLHTIAGLPLLETQGLTRTILDIVETFTYACSTMIYPNSYKMRDIILKNGYCRETKLKIIGNGSSNGIDINHFDPALYPASWKSDKRASLNLSDKDIVFSFVGRIVEPKGIRELVNAFIKMSAVTKDVKLILVGPFDTDKDMLDEHTRNQIMNHPSISWLDFQLDVRPYFAISDVFVFPSYREGFPNVVMQAGAMGLPCIVSDINGCNELIADNVNGLIVPVKDEKSLLQAMLKLAHDKKIRNSMSAESRHRIIDLYDQQYVFNELLKEYALHKSQVGR